MKPNVVWRALLAIVMSALFLFAAMIGIGNSFGIGPLYWLACLAGGALVGAGTKLRRMGIRGAIIVLGALLAVKSLALIFTRDLPLLLHKVDGIMGSLAFLVAFFFCWVVARQSISNRKNA